MITTQQVLQNIDQIKQLSGIAIWMCNSGTGEINTGNLTVKRDYFGQLYCMIDHGSMRVFPKNITSIRKIDNRSWQYEIVAIDNQNIA